MAYHAIHKRRGVQMIQLKRGTVVRLRDSRSGSTKDMRRAIIVGVAPGNNFTRAYGKEYFVCHIGSRSDPHVTRKNDSQFMAVGRVKRLPVSCREALEAYEATYPSLARKKRKR